MMSEPTAIAMEERVGLLQRDEGDGRRSSDSDRESQFMWEEKCTQEKHHTPRRRWTTISTITILLLCTLGLLLHFMIARQGHPTQVAPSPARLRPEEDYILDPQWDFDAQPQSREYSWTIRDHELNPDGVYRPMILINGMFPGPLIECNEGDELVVHVHNRATNATSIHWHGLYQNGTNYMDGTVGVTQCPIAPGHSFTYRFNVTGQSGTYYYHSHVSMQASDGLVGPMIIHTRDGGEKELQMITYEQDRIVMLSDHYYDLSSDLLMQYLAPGSENDEPVPPSALINGRNIRHCPDFPNRNCSADNLSRARFNLSATSNTRLRILNVGAFAEFSLQIDEHEFQVTEVDGTDVHPQSIHRLNINPAQRYSIIVSPPKDSNKSLYWMRARMITHCFAYENPELQEEVWGVINYPSSSNNHSASLDQLPQTKDWTETIEVECRDLNTTLLTPIIPVSFPTSFEHSLYLRSSFQIRDWALSRGYLNDSSFRINATQPILTTLLDAYSDTDVADIPQGVNDNLFDKSKQLVYQTTGTPYISILVQNFDDGTHPFHLHGYKFAVLAQGHGYPPKELLSTLTATNPLRRDTASVEAFGWMLVAFRADNPGVWAWHCHLGWHNEAGLGMVFATRMEQMAGWEGRKEVKQLRGLCGVDGVEKGMGPDDGEWAGEIQDD